MTEARRRLLYTGIENYDHVDLDAGQTFFAHALRHHQCPCCAVSLITFEHELDGPPTQPGFSQLRWLQLQICPVCGWWHYRRLLDTGELERGSASRRVNWWELSHAVHKEVELGSSTLSLDELERLLVRRWEDRRLISAQQAEDLVASLLQEHHGGQVFRVGANANEADGGIDLYLSTQDDGTIQRAIQVKRRITREVEPVQEVRNFIGAMVLANADQGTFVTTASRFSKVAAKLPIKALDAKFKLDLELIDGERLLEMLRVSNAKKPIQLPPSVEMDQEWRSSEGRIIPTSDLFTQDLRELMAEPESHFR